MKRILYLTLLTTIGVIGSAILLGKLQQHNLQAQYPAPGQMVDVGGYNLHIDCRGAGSPTILLEAGQGESSLTWSTIRPQLAQRTRVCAYDRAGYGWSDRSPHPRTVDHLVDELQALLVRGKIPGPYLLVGHSMGGLIMRRFVQRYPQAVIGLVLIDPAHEEMIARLPADWQAHLQAQNLAAQRILRGLALLSATGIAALVPHLGKVDERLPVATQSTVKALQLMDSRYFATLAAEIAAADASLAQMRATPATDWEDKPLVIIEAGKAVNDQPTIDLQLFTPASNLNAELIAQSPQGRLLIAQQSDHYVHYDEPELVLQAIQTVTWHSLRLCSEFLRRLDQISCDETNSKQNRPETRRSGRR